MKRRNFVTATLAALGVSATGLAARSQASEDVPVSTPTPSPAPPVPEEMVYVSEYWGNGVHITYVDGVEAARDRWDAPPPVKMVRWSE